MGGLSGYHGRRLNVIIVKRIVVTKLVACVDPTLRHFRQTYGSQLQRVARWVLVEQMQRGPDWEPDAQVQLSNCHFPAMISLCLPPWDRQYHPHLQLPL